MAPPAKPIFIQTPSNCQSGFLFALPGFLVAKTVLQTTAIAFNIIFYHKTDLFWIVAFSRFLFSG
jgi:hypothetical protein